jgi:molybdate transport system substrate-binding protein
VKPVSFARWLFALVLAALLSLAPASAADIRVMISAGFHGAYAELAPAFERASGHHMVTTRGPSMGDSPESIPSRLSRGEAADVVILDGGAADELGKRGLVRADSKVELARSLIGMVVREGRTRPDIGSVAALKDTLLAAKSIAYSDSGSGTYLSTKLFAQLGVADEIASKSRKVRGPPSGEPVAAVVARGEAEIGFQQVAELIHTPHFRRRAAGRGAADLFLCGRAHPDGSTARGGQRPASFSRIIRGDRGDRKGRADADAGAIAPRASGNSLRSVNTERTTFPRIAGSSKAHPPQAIALDRRDPLASRS